MANCIDGCEYQDQPIIRPRDGFINSCCGGGGGGNVNDVQIDGNSILSGSIANFNLGNGLEYDSTTKTIRVTATGESLSICGDDWLELFPQTFIGTPIQISESDVNTGSYRYSLPTTTQANAFNCNIEIGLDSVPNERTIELRLLADDNSNHLIKRYTVPANATSFRLAEYHSFMLDSEHNVTNIMIMLSDGVMHLVDGNFAFGMGSDLCLKDTLDIQYDSASNTLKFYGTGGKLVQSVNLGGGTGGDMYRSDFANKQFLTKGSADTDWFEVGLSSAVSGYSTIKQSVGITNPDGTSENVIRQSLISFNNNDFVVDFLQNGGIKVDSKQETTTQTIHGTNGIADIELIKAGATYDVRIKMLESVTEGHIETFPNFMNDTGLRGFAYTLPIAIDYANDYRATVELIEQGDDLQLYFHNSYPTTADVNPREIRFMANTTQ